MSNVFVFPIDKSRQFLTSSLFFGFLSVPYGVQERLLQSPFILGPEVLGPLITYKINMGPGVCLSFLPSAVFFDVHLQLTFNTKLIDILITGTKLILASS